MVIAKAWNYGNVMRGTYIFALLFVPFGVLLWQSINSEPGVPKTPACKLLPNSQKNYSAADLRSISRSDHDQGQEFDWPDTTIGATTNPGEDGYLFFAGNGSCHSKCLPPGSTTTPQTLNEERDGSITRVEVKLSDRGEMVASAPREFILKTIARVPSNFDGTQRVLYVGGGPVYRVPPGKPGAGGLLLVYQGAFDTDYVDNAWYSFLGMARSVDNGETWEDLGVVIRSTVEPKFGKTVDVGDGTFVDSGTTDPAGHYFYIYFPDLECYGDQLCSGVHGIEKGMVVARVDYEQFLKAAFAQPLDSSAIPPFKKFYNPAITPWLAPTQAGEASGDSKFWQEPGIGGKSTNIWNTDSPNGAGAADVKWSPYLQSFVAVFDNTINIGVALSKDGLYWSPIQNLVSVSGKNPPTLRYASLVGLGQDPAELGQQFDIYYNSYPNDGSGWDGASLIRVTVDCSP